MAWDEKRSRERVNKNDFHDFELNVADLRKTMDFSNLGPRDVRRAQGVHMYVDVPGFHAAIAWSANDVSKQRKIVRAASVLRKVQGDLLTEDEVGDIQRQTVRAHALVFKPYDSDDTERASDRSVKAVTHAVTQLTYMTDVFCDVFAGYGFDCAVGLAAGTSYIANVGKVGKRELISLGTSANLAAKLLGAKDTIVITRGIYLDLPGFLQEHFQKSSVVAGEQTYVATDLRWSKYPDLAKKLGVKWDADKWNKKTTTYRDDLPLDEISISDAQVLIDVSKLTERNCKRSEAVTIYADLDGFTRYVREVDSNDKVITLIRQFHMIRAEFHSVVETDYNGLVLQHRGDCLLGILHLPCGEDGHSERCDTGVDIAIGLQSSMEHVLNAHLVDREDIHVAVGLDVGKVFVTRLGKQGRRISICFGPRVSSAEALQGLTGGKRTRISQEMYDQLSDDGVKEEFKADGDSYVARDLTFPKLDEKREREAAEAGSIGAAVKEGSIRVTSDARGGDWQNSKPWRS